MVSLLLAMLTSSVLGDVLPGPYDHHLSTRGSVHGPPWDHLEIRRMIATFSDSSNGTQPNTTYDVWELAADGEDDVEANVTTFKLIDTGLKGNVARVNNPRGHFSFKQPVGGCGAENRETVLDSAADAECIVATNAGFFNTTDFTCIGNMIAEGVTVQLPYIQNVNMGITADGKIVTGYFNESTIKLFGFTELIGGVVWLVRNGSIYVDESAVMEDISTQTTSHHSLDGFVNVRAPRVGVGHDKEGRIIVVNLEGDEHTHGGASLYDLARAMMRQGAVNAINLDGGGSSTMVFNGSLVNYPTDHCPHECAPYCTEYPEYCSAQCAAVVTHRCPRRVTTITCIHNKRVPPPPSFNETCAEKCIEKGALALLNQSTVCSSWDCDAWEEQRRPFKPTCAAKCVEKGYLPGLDAGAMCPSWGCLNWCEEIKPFGPACADACNKATVPSNQSDVCAGWDCSELCPRCPPPKAARSHVLEYVGIAVVAALVGAAGGAFGMWIMLYSSRVQSSPMYTISEDGDDYLLPPPGTNVHDDIKPLLPPEAVPGSLDDAQNLHERL